MTNLSPSDSAERCPMVARGTLERCELEEGHNSPHQASGDWGKMTWEPGYVGDLRREIEGGVWRWQGLLADVLEEIPEAWHSEAIDEAREALREAEAA